MSDYATKNPRNTAAGSIGSVMIGVRNDPGGDLSSANGDYGELQLSNDGALKINSEGMSPSFGVVSLSIALAATPTDIFILNGSATKTVKVTMVEVFLSGATGVASAADIQLVKRTAANTGGTSTAPSIAKFDSGDAAATAIALAYTVNPTTLGAGVGLAARKLSYATPGATVGTAAVAGAAWDLSGKQYQKLGTLRGVAEGLAVNLNGQTLGGTTTATVTVWFTELPSTV